MISVSLLPPLVVVASQKRRRLVLTPAALTKRAERFLTSLANSTDDAQSSNRLIKKFVASSPKSASLDALSHLLSPHHHHSHRTLSSLALPLYVEITEATWFEWNPKLVAQVAAFLNKQGLTSESEALISSSVSKLTPKSERELSLFYCYVLELHSEHGSIPGFNDSYARLSQLVQDSNSVYVKRQCYKSMVKGLCQMGRPKEAEGLVFRGEHGIEASVFEFRCVLLGYGRLGLFEDMERVFNLMVGIKDVFCLDTVSFNMMLGSYGAHNALSHMVVWVQRMKALGVPVSLRTCNTVFNACPTLMAMVCRDLRIPVSMGQLVNVLEEGEAALVRELAGCALALEGVMKWDDLEGKLDLHGMHLGTAYVVILEWMEELCRRLHGGDKECVAPVGITVVCGLGNHSSVRGESPVKCLVKEMMTKTGSPLRVDRKNRGCFVANGKVVKEWISTL